MTTIRNEINPTVAETCVRRVGGKTSKVDRCLLVIKFVSMANLTTFTTAWSPK